MSSLGRREKGRPSQQRAGRHRHPSTPIRSATALKLSRTKRRRRSLSFGGAEQKERKRRYTEASERDISPSIEARRTVQEGVKGRTSHMVKQIQSSRMETKGEDALWQRLSPLLVIESLI